MFINGATETYSPITVHCGVQIQFLTDINVQYLELVLDLIVYSLVNVIPVLLNTVQFVKLIRFFI